MTTKILKHVKFNSSAILNGKFIAIDPSCGSYSSMPGYAIYESGVLVDSGIIEVNTSWPLYKRLREISMTLMWEFDSYDLLIIEQIKAHFGRGSDSLHKGIGAILSAVDCKDVIYMPVRTWKRFLPVGYYKTDEYDAIAIGNAAIELAKEFDK